MPVHESPSASELFQTIDRGLTLPLDIAVKSSQARRILALARPHVISKNLLDGYFVDAGEELFVSTAELCFVQMARVLPIVELIKLGYELCGSYSLPACEHRTIVDDVSGTNLSQHQPLTSHKKLLSYSCQFEGERGAGQAAKALRHITDGSASPMETALTMLLTLPHKLGGYGLPIPELNARIQPINSVRQSASKGSYFCDLFWPEYKLAAEYDSNQYHTGAEHIASDSKRRNTLATLGITVITVTSQQLRNLQETEKVAKLLATNMNKRLRFDRSPSFLRTTAL
ncbi:MAG: endonuclease domain-containing protein [Coriobacteriales bacterium]|nr:endonuclease domain-containing protein [Coriobacteriales bacterium]